MGREHDFFVGDFVLVGIVFLLLVVFREQLLAALVGGGRNSRFIVAPLDDGDFTVRRVFSFLMGCQFDKLEFWCGLLFFSIIFDTAFFLC